jgi:EmrB/QacA subfamily drug resistance transporter
MTTQISEAIGSPDVEPAANPHHERRWLILAILGLAQLMVVLDATIVNIALPTAQRALAFSNADRQWIVTGYALSFGSLLLLGGRLSDLLGRKRALLIGLVGFAGASAIGGFSTSFTMLLVARICQGSFGALLAPAALALLTTTFTEPGERQRAFGIYGAIAGAGGAVGLLLGGVLTSYVSWRWTLFVNLAIAAVAVPSAIALLHNSRQPNRAPLDLPGVLTGTAGLFALVYGLSHAASTSWGNAVTVGSVVVAAVLLAIFVAVESRAAHPLLPLRVVVDRNRGGSFLAMFFAGAGMFGVFLFLTYYLQGTLHFSPVRTGIAFLPLIGALIIVAQLATNVLLPRFGPKVPVAVGMAMAALSMVALTHIGLHSSYATAILPALLVMGVAFGLIMAPAMNMATAGVEPGDAGVASAMVNTAQQVGGSIGTALLNTLAASAVTAFIVDHHPLVAGAGPRALATAQALATVHGYSVAFGWAAGIFAVGAVLAGLLLRGGPPNRAKQEDETPTLAVVA